MAITFKEIKTPIPSEEIIVTAADVKRIKEQVSRANQNLSKQMKIAKKEAKAWEKSQKRRFSF